MYIIYKNKKIAVRAKKVSFFGKFFGLMFRSRNTENLLFDFSEKKNLSVHSLFVFFPFLIIWLDKHNRVIGQRVVSPFSTRIRPSSRYQRFIEFPFNAENASLIALVDGKI